MTETRLFQPHDPSIITMGRKPNPDKCHELADTIKRDGQLQPGICAPVPPEWHTMPRDKLNAVLRSYMIEPREFTPHTRFVQIAGNRRRTACWLVDLPHEARMLDALPPPIEATRMAWHENESREKMKVYDRAEYIEAMRRAMPGASMEAVAKALGGDNPSASTIRNELQPKNIPESWRPRTAGLHQQVIRIIGAIEKPDHMDAAITFACGDGVTHATQAAVIQYIKELKRTVGRKPGKLKITVDGMEIIIPVNATDTATDAAKRVDAVVKTLYKGGNTPAYACGHLFA